LTANEDIFASGGNAEPFRSAAERALGAFDADLALKIIKLDGNPPGYKTADDVKETAARLLDKAIELAIESEETTGDVESGCLRATVYEDIDIGFYSAHIFVVACAASGFYEQDYEDDEDGGE